MFGSQPSLLLLNIMCLDSGIKKAVRFKYDSDGFTERLTLHTDTQNSKMGEQSVLEGHDGEVR